ncbi:MAG: PAS-domain containing protein [Pseudomonadota bacterium]
MDPSSLLGENQDLARENAKLRRIAEVLMRRVEQKTDEDGSGFAHFETALLLERRVKARTRDLEDALEMLNITNARLASARARAELAEVDLTNALEAFDEGFALFDADDLLVRKNSRFAAFAPDVAQRIRPGIAFAEYVGLIAGSDHLGLSDGTRAHWRTERLAAHARQSVNFTAGLTGDRWIQVSEQRLPDGSTTVLQTDITDTVRLEREEREKLLDAQARLVRATLDHIDQGVAVFDGQARLTAWNRRLQALLNPPSRLLRKGVSFARILSTFETGWRVLPGDASESLSAWVAGPRCSPLHCTMQGPGGLIVALHCDSTPERGFVVSLTDITAEREAAAALHRANESLERRVEERTHELAAARDTAEQANASKTRFVAAASHDLLQPLNAAKLFIAALGEKKLNAEQAALTDRIERAFGSVESLLGALLDICRLDTHAVAPQVAEFPLERLLRSLRSDFAATAERKGLDLRVLPTSLTVQSDPTHLHRILQNLLSNAIRYTEHGRVLVGVKREGASVRIMVADTGIGIAKADQRAVFEEFRRLGESSGELPGMGLGLAIVERACRLLNHDLSLTSVPGRGTTFSVSVPLVGIERHTEPRPRPSETPDLDTMIVLVVESDAHERDALAHLLESWGASPVVAESATEARALIGELGLTPDAVIAEHRLGGVESGLGFLARLRADNPDFLGVLIAGARPEGLREGAAAASLFLRQAPLDPNDLGALLASARQRGAR